MLTSLSCVFDKHVFTSGLLRSNLHIIKLLFENFWGLPFLNHFLKAFLPHSRGGCSGAAERESLCPFMGSLFSPLPCETCHLLLGADIAFQVFFQSGFVRFLFSARSCIVSEVPSLHGCSQWTEPGLFCMLLNCRPVCQPPMCWDYGVCHDPSLTLQNWAVFKIALTIQLLILLIVGHFFSKYGVVCFGITLTTQIILVQASS